MIYYANRKNDLVNCFHEILSNESKILLSKHCKIHSVEITEIFSHSFLAKICESDNFTKKKLLTTVIWRNIFSVRVNFRNFHSVHCTLWKFRQLTPMLICSNFSSNHFSENFAEPSLENRAFLHHDDFSLIT